MVRSRFSGFFNPTVAMATRVVSTVITSLIGALVSLLVERAWRRRKQKQLESEGTKPSERP